MKIPGMNDDPNLIADHLIGQHGGDGALAVVRDGIAMEKANGNNYRLSVWREVRGILQAKLVTSDGQDAPSV